MKKNNQALEVLEPEVEEIPLEEVINNSLVKHNITDAVIASLKERYSGMKLKSLDDKEGFLDIKEARKEVRKIGILCEKTCKLGREQAIAIQKKWLSKEKEILGKISEVEDPLNSEIKKFEDEVERKEIEEKNRFEVRWINRNHALLKLGVQYNNGNWDLNHISYESELLKQADEDTWNDTILPKYKKEFEAIEAVKVEEENKRKAELERQKKEREDLELQQAEFKKQQELFAKQQRELQEQKDAHDREVRLVQEQKDKEEREKAQALVDARTFQIRDLGMEYNLSESAYVFGDVRVFKDALLYEQKEWNKLIESITPSIQKLIKESQQKIADDLEKQKQDAIQKALEAEEFKKKQSQELRLMELAVAKDKEKYADVVAYLKKTPIHAMASNIYKSKMTAINDFIQDL